MNRDREELFDFILGEGPEPSVRDEAAEAEIRAAIAAVRAAATGGSWAPVRRLRLLRPALAVAAALLVAATAFLLNGAAPPAVYEPDVAYGALLPEETDSHGCTVPPPPSVSVPTMRAGEAAFSALGAGRPQPLKPDDEVPFDSEIEAADEGARIDLPDGAMLFVAPGSRIRLMRHQAGGPALRVLHGTAATVAGRAPLHLAVHETELLVRQESGALVLRQTPGEVIALRGVADLLLEGGKAFRIPPGERLPAACAREPATSPATTTEMDLGWYLQFAHGGGLLADVAWEAEGRSEPLSAPKGTMLFLRLLPSANGRAEVSFGGAARTFELDAGKPLALRLRLSDLGQGPRLVVTPASALRQARLFRPGRD